MKINYTNDQIILIKIIILNKLNMIKIYYKNNQMKFIFIII